MNKKIKISLLGTLVVGSTLAVALPIVSNSVASTTQLKIHGNDCSCGSCSITLLTDENLLDKK